MSTGHSLSHRPQCVHLCWSIVTWIKEILFVIASTAPNGQRYRHVKRLMNIDDNTKNTNTTPSSGVVQWKLKTASAGQISRSGG